MEKEIGERFRDLRNYLKKTGPKLAAELGISKKTISAIEAEGRSLTRELIQKICNKYQIDARYFFDQIDTPEEADISKRGKPDESRLESIASQLKEIRARVQPIAQIDPVAERVLVNQELHELVELVQFWDGSMIRRIKDVAYGYISGFHDQGEKKENLEAG